MVLTDAIAPELTPNLADELTAIAESLQRATVHVRGHGMGSGSGVIWSPDGLIVTNAHVVHSPTAIVELWDGRKLEAEVIARDPQRDLAALRITSSAVGPLPAATVGDSDALRVGELVVAVGNPLGLSGALTSGVVHAVGRNSGRGPLDTQGWVRADIRLAPGNSGGPLADAQGRVVGINSMVAGGLGLAVPSNAVKRFLRNGGRRPQIGIALQPVLVPRGRERLPGLLILEVAPGSPAERAGLLIGDVIVGTAGLRGANTYTPLKDSNDLSGALEGMSAGESLRLQIVRGGTALALDVTLEREASTGPREEGETGEAA